MKAILRQGPKKVKVIEMDRPEAPAGEVVVRVTYCGICGSDIHRLTEDNEKWDKIVIGHEFSGTIEELGEGVKGLKAGQPVSVAPLCPCQNCALCGQGLFSQCPGYSFIGSRRQGAFAQYVCVPAANIVPLPETLDLRAGALLEPITVVLHPLMMLENQLCRLETAVVTGLGAIGLIAVQALRFMGAKNIVASDIVPEKIELAKELGATHGVNVKEQKLEEVVESLGGANVVFESSGTVPAKKSAVAIAASRGTILLVGTSPRDVTFEAALFERITRKELCLLGSWMNYSAPWPGKEWQTAAWMLDKGYISQKLFTHEYSLEQAQTAMDMIVTNSEPYVKILFKM